MALVMIISIVVLLPWTLLDSTVIYTLLGEKMGINDYDMRWFIYLFDKEYVRSLNEGSVHESSTGVNPMARFDGVDQMSRPPVDTREGSQHEQGAKTVDSDSTINEGRTLELIELGTREEYGL